MLDLAEKQRLRDRFNRRNVLLWELDRLGVYQVKHEKMTLFDLEQIHITEKCRVANKLGGQHGL